MSNEKERAATFLQTDVPENLKINDMKFTTQSVILSKQGRDSLPEPVSNDRRHSLLNAIRGTPMDGEHLEIRQGTDRDLNQILG